MEKILGSDPDVHLEYLAICDSKNLEPLTQVRGTVVILGAVRLGNIRLIDNLLVRCPRSQG